MKTILTVFKKEMIDTLRDRRTLVTAIIMPAVLLPLLLFGITKFSKVMMDKEANKKLKLALLNPPAEFLATIDTSEVELIEGYEKIAGGKAIQADSLDVMIGFQDEFAAKQEGLKTSKVDLWFKSTNLKSKGRMTALIEDYEESLLDKRIELLDISSKSIDPIQIRAHEMATAEEQVGKLAGGFLPYFFLIFCFTGCMYPALDLITGEKERGTIETLLTVPASRFNILMGKVMTISIVGLAAAIMGIIGLLAGIKFLPDIPEELLEALTSMVSPKFIFMLLAMLVPLCVFFAGVLSALVIKAKSFKEAQSIVSPFMMLVFIPAGLAMVPGLELDWKTAFVPILNIALATKEIIAGTINMNQYAVILISLVLIAIIAVIFSYRQFSKEGMVLKS